MIPFRVKYGWGEIKRMKSKIIRVDDFHLGGWTAQKWMIFIWDGWISNIIEIEMSNQISKALYWNNFNFKGLTLQKWCRISYLFHAHFGPSKVKILNWDKIFDLTVRCSDRSLEMSCSACLVFVLFAQTELFGLFGIRTVWLVRHFFSVCCSECSTDPGFRPFSILLKVNFCHQHHTKNVTKITLSVTEVK